MNGSGGTELKNPPCILYFDQTVRSSAFEIRNLVKGAQNIPDERIKYISPAKLPDLFRELINVSGIDIVVVLGKQP